MQRQGLASCLGDAADTLMVPDWIDVKQKARRLLLMLLQQLLTGAAPRQTFVPWGAAAGRVTPSLACGLFALTTESLESVFSAC